MLQEEIKNITEWFMERQLLQESFTDRNYQKRNNN
jgi:hypothetical protein